MMKIIRFLMFYTFLCVCPSVLFAESDEVRSDAKDRSAIAVTIYNENLALVKDKRNITFKTGINNIAFIEVSANIRPETAIVTGKNLSVLEQNFNFDLLTHENILQKSLGNTVKVIQINPATGEQTTEDAVLLSANPTPVLKIGDRIETRHPGRIVYSSVPANLRDKPTLVLMIDSTSEGLKEMELGYLTGGLGWRADYVAELNDSEDSLNLNGWVTLTNQSGVNYENTQLQLVAGDVNIVQREMNFMRKSPMANAEMLMADSRGGDMEQESFSDFHLYSLPRLTSIFSNQTKQVSLLSAKKVQTTREYKIVNPFGVYNGTSGQFENRNVTIYQTFKNEELNNLGMPLPKGTIRVYKADSKGKLLFAGEDNIKHTAKNAEIKLNLGNAFDITASGKQSDYKRISNTVFENTYELIIKNPRDKEVTVAVAQNISGDWRIISESSPHEKVNSAEALWKIPVKANSESVLSFSVMVSN